MKHKKLIANRADPQIYKHVDGMYYFTATVPEYDRIIIRGASNINELRTVEEKVIWYKHDEGEMSAFIWAPEIHYVDGQFVIYFAAKASATLNHMDAPHRICILRCTGQNPLEDEWVEEGYMDTGWSSFSLDASYFEYQKKKYFVWAQMELPEIGNSNIYIAEMIDYKTLKLPAVCLSKPELQWECIKYKVNEGPAAIIKGDSLHITYSASATDHNYCLGLLSLKLGENPLDSNKWAKSLEPIFKTDDELGIYGPGHNSFTVSEDGNSIIMIYHAREYKDIEGDPLHDPNRHAMMVPLDVILK